MGRYKGHGPGTESNRVLRTALLGTANVILETSNGVSHCHENGVGSVYNKRGRWCRWLTKIIVHCHRPAGVGLRFLAVLDRRPEAWFLHIL